MASPIVIWVCPVHGVVDMDKGQASMLDGEPFCTVKENDKMCVRDVEIVSTVKSVQGGCLVSKTKKEIEKEIRAILNKHRTGGKYV